MVTPHKLGITTVPPLPITTLTRWAARQANLPWDGGGGLKAARICQTTLWETRATAGEMGPKFTHKLQCATWRVGAMGFRDSFPTNFRWRPMCSKRDSQVCQDVISIDMSWMATMNRLLHGSNLAT